MTLWNEIKNKRRIDLINKEVDETLTESEEKELVGLQKEFLEWRNSKYPLPNKELRELLDDLKKNYG